VLAEGVFGKGDGSRSLLSKLGKGCVMHDSSYHCPLQLSGTSDGLFQLLTLMRQLQAPPSSEVFGPSPYM